MEKDEAQKLYELCYMRVYSYVLTLTRDRSSAEELTQETFYRAMTAKKPFRGESGEVTWLCAIAKNLFFDETRKRGREQPLPEGDAPSGEDLQQSVADADDAFRVHKAMHELNEPHREVFEMRVFGELSFRQIGAIFGKTENWARVTYHRARLKIQERMGERDL